MPTTTTPRVTGKLKKMSSPYKLSVFRAGHNKPTQPASAPGTVRAKALVQEISWIDSINWPDVLSGDLKPGGRSGCSELSQLSNVAVPVVYAQLTQGRLIYTSFQILPKMPLRWFAIWSSDTWTTPRRRTLAHQHAFCLQSCPMRGMTIPRLELIGAVPFSYLESSFPTAQA